MSEEERRAWDERYATGEYQPRSTAGAFLEAWIDRLPTGRALDLACGTGRHALRLAEAGQQVTAVDISAVAIETARAAAEARGLAVDWVVADLDTYPLPAGAYQAITVIRYVNRGLWPRLVDALAPGGWLIVEHHMKTTLDVAGPQSPDFRVAPQELLEAFSDLRVLLYEEVLEPADLNDGRYALARIVACNGDSGW
ncbi:MAG: methyltransferase domain-containing protein [Acidimicrobiia bacterium]|nr:methyltransferase domain-containing protein [Acidimicrobiia bacterium]